MRGWIVEDKLWWIEQMDAECKRRLELKDRPRERKDDKE